MLWEMCVLGMGGKDIERDRGRHREIDREWERQRQREGGDIEDLFILFLLTFLWAFVSRRRWRKFRHKEEAGTGQGSCSPQCFGLFLFFFHSLLDQPPREPSPSLLLFSSSAQAQTPAMCLSLLSPGHCSYFPLCFWRSTPQNYSVLHLHPCSFRRAEAFPGLLSRNSLKNNTLEERQKSVAFRPKTDPCIDVYYYKLNYIL